MKKVQKTENEKDNNIWCVYIHRNLHNDKKYIGLTKDINTRWRNNGSSYLRKDKEGKYEHPAFAYALKKYDDWNKDWSHEIVADNLTKNEAVRLEIDLIALYKTNCLKYNNPKYGYNMTDGGEGHSGAPLSEETKQKIREAHVGKKATEETKRKLSKAHKGRVVSEETRQKLSKALSGENNYMYGKHLSEETKKKLSDALSGEKNPMYGKKRPRELIEKMVNASQQKWKDTEYKEKMSKLYSQMYSGKNNPKARPIVQLTKDGDLVRYWDYIGEAAKYFNVSEACIRACCGGRQKTSCGYKWMYREDYEEWIKNNVL